MMKKLIVLFLVFSSCADKNPENVLPKRDSQLARVDITAADKIKIDSLWKRANRVWLYSLERQLILDSILEIKPDSAYFWQQKAMPLYKARKYSLGKPFLAKAVEYDSARYLPYSAFMKCLFSKEYQESIEEFMKVKEKYGDSYVMDHTYNFYLGLDYLQLNEFEKAKEFLEKSKEQQFKDFPDDPPHEACHYMDWFYLGIVLMELHDYGKAIECFDNSLKVYEDFADAMFYKASCYYALGDLQLAKELVEKAKTESDNTINEDQVVYEIYPYQVFHRLSPYSKLHLEK
ncbi:tetratricopeptide repeat protein [Euzebyella marina]|nr:tetratricopeptide repeat protein [Euzebyella marina]